MDVARGLLAVGYSMVFVYSVRGAGMYALTTTTLLANAKILPRWLAVMGYLLAAFLLISTTMNPVVMLLLPAWAVLVGLVILIRTRNLAEPNAPQEKTHDYHHSSDRTQHRRDPGPERRTGPRQHVRRPGRSHDPDRDEAHPRIRSDDPVADAGRRSVRRLRAWR